MSVKNEEEMTYCGSASFAILFHGSLGVYLDAAVHRAYFSRVLNSRRASRLVSLGLTSGGSKAMDMVIHTDSTRLVIQGAPRGGVSQILRPMCGCEGVLAGGRRSRSE
jgi:hypothetical protein